MNVFSTPLAGLWRIEPRVFGDARGYFLETFQKSRFGEHGLPTEFVQDNHSHSRKGIVRGLHFQSPQAQGKLISVLSGEIWDVVVDIRPSSPTWGQWYGVILSSSNHWQLYVPEGFAHGFCVLSDTADVLYKCTTPYAPATEKTLLWNDPELNIPWPVTNPVLSARDQQGAPLHTLRATTLRDLL